MQSRIRFWKPGNIQPDQELCEERESKENNVVYNKYADLSLANQRQRLPVFHYRNHMLYLLEQNQTVVVIGETGSGKSTQLPQYLVESGWTIPGTKQILITQPRRIAAVSLATRVAEERGALLGDEVGYAIRFEECCDVDKTVIKFVTDGVLLREMMADPMLKKYCVVIVDEAHERSLNTDMCVGLLKKIQRKRQDLRIIISSATASAESFKKFFSSKTESAAILSVEGRNYPIETFYSINPVADYVQSTVDTVLLIHLNEKDGDILVFLTGQEEVDKAVDMLIERLRKLKSQGNKKYLNVVPLYSALPSHEQMKVFERDNRKTRRAIISTNIAETSVTIDGIVFIIDSGFVKLKIYNPKTAVESLIVCQASKASLEQRAGRAGRSRNGKVYRLFPEEYIAKLDETTPPEMQRSSLVSVILQLKALGVDNVLRFHFLSPPPAQCMIRGLELLYALGALDDDGKLTHPLGQNMAEFPVNPMLAKMLLESEKFECSEEIVTIAALLQVQNVTLMSSNDKGKAKIEHRKFAVSQGDHLTLLNIYECFVNEGNKTRKWCEKFYLNYRGLKRADKIRSQLCKYLNRFNIRMVSCGRDIVKIQQCILSGFFANAACLHGNGAYRGLHNNVSFHLHPSCVLVGETPPKWIIFNEIIETVKLFARDVTVIEPEWLQELAPHFYGFHIERAIASKRAKLA